MFSCSIACAFLYPFICNRLIISVEVVKCSKNKKASTIIRLSMLFSVGMTGFEPATTRPPDAYSNRTELHPVLRVQK